MHLTLERMLHAQLRAHFTMMSTECPFVDVCKAALHAWPRGARFGNDVIMVVAETLISFSFDFATARAPRLVPAKLHVREVKSSMSMC